MLPFLSSYRAQLGGSRTKKAQLPLTNRQSSPSSPPVVHTDRKPTKATKTLYPTSAPVALPPLFKQPPTLVVNPQPAASNPAPGGHLYMNFDSQNFQVASRTNGLQDDRRLILYLSHFSRLAGTVFISISILFFYFLSLPIGYTFRNSLGQNNVGRDLLQPLLEITKLFHSELYNRDETRPRLRISNNHAKPQNQTTTTYMIFLPRFSVHGHRFLCTVSPRCV
jgi:hypothetical protein